MGTSRRSQRADGPTIVASNGGMTRRELLAGLGLGVGATLVLGACTMPAPGATPPKPPPGVPDPAPFAEGIMSGDPLPGAGTLWTRVSPPADGRDVPVLWTVAEDPAFSSIVAGGVVTAAAANDHCLTVPVAGLATDRWYFYRFETSEGTGVPAAVSRTGRLRTAPAPGASTDRLRYVFSSCQQLNDSWFVAHKAVAAEPDLDFFMHLGDYIYVSDSGTQTLEDYRALYRRWRNQPYLRDLHAAVPTVAMWDDGEFYNGVDRTGPAERLANGRRAWFDYFPLANPGDDRAYRGFGWGDLAEMSVIDVRSYRDPALDAINYVTDQRAYDSSRTTLGSEQFGWLTQRLAASTTKWRLVGNQYAFSPWRLLNLEFLRPFNPDLPSNAGIYAPAEAWDDYLQERRDLLQFLADRGVTDTIFNSGDAHVYLATQMQPDYDNPASPVVAFDFTTGSLTADPDPRRAFFPDLPPDIAEGIIRIAEQWMIGQNRPYLRHINLVNQGYTLVDVTPEETTVTMRVVDTFDPDAGAVDAAKFRIVRGSRRIETLHASNTLGSFS
ncbi:MAG: alkaline phosphatase D family protein [Actinomycetes bacterium]